MGYDYEPRMDCGPLGCLVLELLIGALIVWLLVSCG